MLLTAKASAAALVAVSVAAAWVSAATQRTAAPQPGAAPTSGACRTYDTSVISVTEGGGVRTTIEWTGVFDPSSARFVQNVNYSSNQGSHFSYVQVSSWTSVEDFIAEVVRLKAPAAIATNPAGPMVGIVPPLTRSLNTIANGAIGLTKTNRYDSTGRVTGFTTRTAGGTMTMRYTAWDPQGRPTAGTMQSPGPSSALTIRYDDKALTQTETMTTGAITSVMVYAYDRLGNLRSTTSTVSGGQPSTTTVTSRGTAQVCLGDKRKPDVPPLPPAGPNPAGTFSGSIGGRAWSSSVGVRAENTGASVSIGGSDGRYIVSIGFSGKNGPGEYQAGALATDANALAGPDATKLTKEEFTRLIERNSVVAMVFDSQSKQSWQASPTIGGGTVTVTSLAGRATGTCSLTLDAVPGSGASGSIRFSGTFNIRY